MNNLKLVDLQDHQLKELKGGWIRIMPPAGFAPMVFQILSMQSAVEGYKDSTEK